MRTCPRCGESTSIWSAGLLSGICKKCQDAETAEKEAGRQQEQALARQKAEKTAGLAYDTQYERNRTFLEARLPKRVQFQIFKSSLDSWGTLFIEAASFASQLPPDALISISHSADQGKGIVTVWYWSKQIH